MALAARSARAGAPRLYVFETCPNVAEQLKNARVKKDGKDAVEVVDPDWETRLGHTHASARYGVMSWPDASTNPSGAPPPVRSLAGVEELRKLSGRSDRDHGRYEY